MSDGKERIVSTSDGQVSWVQQRVEPSGPLNSRTEVGAVSRGVLDRLNRTSINSKSEIRKLLSELRDKRVILQNGINDRNNPRRAFIEVISSDRVLLRTENLDQGSPSQLFLNFEFGGDRYLFSAARSTLDRNSKMWIDLPSAIYLVERRQVARRTAENHNGVRVAIDVSPSGPNRLIGRVLNWSNHGLKVEFSDIKLGELPRTFPIRFLSGERAGELLSAQVRHRSSSGGLLRIGLSLRYSYSQPLIEVDRRTRIVDKSAITRAREGAAVIGAAIRSAPSRLWRTKGVSADLLAEVPVVVFSNESGQQLSAIINSWGDPRGATAVIVPPAWGRTKETLLPLASTIVETFRRSRQPIVVMRFDGTNRRGESYIDPSCRARGSEYLRFRFSQAARDILAAVRFLSESHEYQPSTIILATFSLTSIEGRHAIAIDKSQRIAGWVSAVGMVDLQSALRTISGGIDFAYGLEKGVRFGRHELVGVIADMDYTGLDALAHRMVFLEDARREMSEIEAPITWIHGRDDAWMDLQRVRDMLSCGSTENRKLIEVPTGHQLRTSKEALSTFQLIAEEVGRMATGRRLQPVLPRLGLLDKATQAERYRRPRPTVDLREFWRDYLLGRDRRFGMQLLTATSAYRDLMRAQVEMLELESDTRVADLGAGTGEFLVNLVRGSARLQSMQVDELDYVTDALRRSRARQLEMSEGDHFGAWRVVADIDVSRHLCLPLSSSLYDAVLASLVISYLQNPASFLAEVFRVLKPGGRLVVSTLRPDPDISRLFVDGLSELRARGARSSFQLESDHEFDSLARDFLNDASRILDFEEDGHFRFWDTDEFVDLVVSAGFERVSTSRGLGDPPQAVLVSACRPTRRIP